MEKLEIDARKFDLATNLHFQPFLLRSIQIALKLYRSCHCLAPIIKFKFEVKIELQDPSFTFVATKFYIILS
jgi:hypothetical protein